jgi:hypothetical protein
VFCSTGPAPPRAFKCLRRELPIDDPEAVVVRPPVPSPPMSPVIAKLQRRMSLTHPDIQEQLYMFWETSGFDPISQVLPFLDYRRLHMTLSRILLPDAADDLQHMSLLAERDYDRATNSRTIPLTEPVFLNSMHDLMQSRSSCTHVDCLQFTLGTVYHVVEAMTKFPDGFPSGYDPLGLKEADPTITLSFAAPFQPPPPMTEEHKQLFRVNPHQCQTAQRLVWNGKYSQCRCIEKFLNFLTAYRQGTTKNDPDRKQTMWMEAFQQVRVCVCVCVCEWGGGGGWVGGGRGE